jgi:hypothetical protein
LASLVKELGRVLWGRGALGVRVSSEEWGSCFQQGSSVELEFTILRLIYVCPDICNHDSGSFYFPANALMLAHP